MFCFDLLYTTRFLEEAGVEGGVNSTFENVFGVK